MKLNFIFKKDWSSFKSGQILEGEVKETGNSAPFTLNNPQYSIEFNNGVKVPFCYQGEPILEAGVAPWLCQIGKIDLTPTPKGNTTTGNLGNLGSVVPLGKRIFSLRNVIIILVVIVLIGIYLKYGRNK